jgi:hypothetical protein
MRGTKEPKAYTPFITRYFFAALVLCLIISNFSL